VIAAAALAAVGGLILMSVLPLLAYRRLGSRRFYATLAAANTCFCASAWVRDDAVLMAWTGTGAVVTLALLRATPEATP
jgi:hypothetical protein